MVRESAFQPLYFEGPGFESSSSDCLLFLSRKSRVEHAFARASMLGNNERSIQVGLSSTS